jgi:hypothetical protein
MPTPVSNNSSVYDLSSQLAEPLACDPSNASCNPPQVLTIPPVYIEADPGKDQLVQQLDAARSTCTTQKLEAILTCAAAGATALSAVAAAGASFGIGAAAGFLATTVASANCGKELRALADCERP